MTFLEALQTAEIGLGMDVSSSFLPTLGTRYLVDC